MVSVSNGFVCLHPPRLADNFAWNSIHGNFHPLKIGVIGKTSGRFLNFIEAVL